MLPTVEITTDRFEAIKGVAIIQDIEVGVVVTTSTMGTTLTTEEVTNEEEGTGDITEGVGAARGIMNHPVAIIETARVS